MNDLWNEMEQTLADLLRSGLDTGGFAAMERLRALAVQCEDIGLHTGAALLVELADGLAARMNTIKKDDLPAAETFCRLIRYLELCRKKQQEEAILHRWREQKPEA